MIYGLITFEQDKAVMALGSNTQSIELSVVELSLALSFSLTTRLIPAAGGASTYYPAAALVTHVKLKNDFSWPVR
ncbi:MAG: hypothetical protein ACLQLH_12445, partial [Terracidiphilus sp.]